MSLVTLPMSTSSPDIEAQGFLGKEKDFLESSRDVEKDTISLVDMLPTNQPAKAPPTSFFFWILVNTSSTIAIVFTNKAIFDDPSFKHMQSSFAAFHFACTALTLFVASKRPFGMFNPRRTGLLDILPLALAMCLNVILPNLSLAYSSITFYQIARILLTPLVALINYFFYQISIPYRAAWCLIPVCLGVGIVSYFDTLPVTNKEMKVTTPPGVIFALTGVMASSLYTVWIGTYHKKLNMSSMQLLFNQAPVASGLLLFFIPHMDTLPQWETIPLSKWSMICISGILASLINLSQFFIVANAGAVSSTVVGHAKTCSIVVLGWATSGRSVSDRSLLGILMAIGGILTYSIIMARSGKKA